MDKQSTQGKWSARCDCYKGHSSASGRCNHRDVTDPTATQTGHGVICEDCRRECMPKVIAKRQNTDEPCARCGEPLADDDRDELEPTMHADCADEAARIKADDYADSAYDRMMDDRATAVLS